MLCNLSDGLIWKGDGWSVEVIYSRAGVSTSILVSLDSGTVILLDCGDGTLRDLLNKGVDIMKVEAVLFSHGHFDHIGGLYTLLGYMLMMGRTDQLLLMRPEGSRRIKLVVDAFINTYSGSLPFAIISHQVLGGEEINVAGIKVSPFKVVHHSSTEHYGIGEPLPSVGYTLHYHNSRVVYTGDCGLESNLEEHIDGADLVIIEATLEEAGGEIEEKVHLSLERAEELARLAKRAFFVHRVGDEPMLDSSK